MQRGSGRQYSFSPLGVVTAAKGKLVCRPVSACISYSSSRINDPLQAMDAYQYTFTALPIVKVREPFINFY